MLSFLGVVLALIAFFVARSASSKSNKLGKELQALQEAFRVLKEQGDSPQSVSSQSSNEAASENAETIHAAKTTATERIPDVTQVDLLPEHDIAVTPLADSVSPNTTPDTSPSVAPVVSTASIEAAEDESVFDRLLDRFGKSMRENWLVWVGALAMLIGGAYLAQVIGSKIEFSPLMRAAIAFGLSLTVIIGGEWFHRREQRDKNAARKASSFSYVPAALTATGLTGLYCTVAFSYVFYQFFSPFSAMSMMACVVFISLALTLRQGPLLAILGLFGGYTAPLWVFAPLPDYLLLGAYICSVTIAGTMLASLVRKAWLTPAIAAPHFIWMMLITVFVPRDEAFTNALIFLPLSVYLLIGVPRLGWLLNRWHKHVHNWITHNPGALAALLVLPMLTVSVRLTPSILWEHALPFLYLAFIAWLPAIRQRIAPRAFYPATLVAAFMLLGLPFFNYGLDDTLPAREALIGLATALTLISVRTVLQYLLGDNSKVAAWMMIATGPVMAAITLAFISEFMPHELTFWSVFVLGIALFYAALGLKFARLSADLSACVHLIMLSMSFAWLDDSTLTTTISAQILLMTVQKQFAVFAPADWAVKLAMSLMVLRLTLLPFVPDWQPPEDVDWLWGVISYVPTLLLLGYARTVLMRADRDLANWFEGAFLHVFLVALFSQTNYWLTGHYGFVELDFTSLAAFANQALVMAMVYQYRSKLVGTLQSLYIVYTYLLLAAFTLSLVMLNTIHSPLIVNSVSASAMPFFNMLSLGWLLPGVILLGTYVAGFRFEYLLRATLGVGGLVLSGFWLLFSIRQFWQETSMTIFNPTGMAEVFTYSVAGLIVGAVLTWGGVMRHSASVQRIGLAVLAMVAVKVFVIDVSSLDGFWRAASFLGLGASLIALGWLFQKLNKSIQAA